MNLNQDVGHLKKLLVSVSQMLSKGREHYQLVGRCCWSAMALSRFNEPGVKTWNCLRAPHRKLLVHTRFIPLWIQTSFSWTNLTPHIPFWTCNSLSIPFHCSPLHAAGFPKSPAKHKACALFPSSQLHEQSVSASMLWSLWDGGYQVTPLGSTELAAVACCGHNDNEYLKQQPGMNSWSNYRPTSKAFILISSQLWNLGLGGWLTSCW